MESASESDGSRGAKAILRSPTVIFSSVLVAVYIIIGAIVGNFFEPIQLQNTFVPDCAVGASGAIYGIMGTAVGLKVVLLLIFLLGLDIFANGGGPAHLGGLVAGLILRRYWSLGGGTFRGI